MCWAGCRRLPARRRRAGMWYPERLITKSVLSPPQRHSAPPPPVLARHGRRQAAAGESRREPSAGTAVCTSSECSAACAASLTTTCGRWATAATAAWFTATMPSGGGKGAGGRQRQTVHRHPVCRPEQDDAPDVGAPFRQRRVNAGSDRSGVDVAGMRGDDRLHVPAAGRRWRCAVGQHLPDFAGEGGRRSRIDTGDGCRAGVRCRVHHVDPPALVCLRLTGAIA